MTQVEWPNNQVGGCKPPYGGLNPLFTNSSEVLLPRQNANLEKHPISAGASPVFFQTGEVDIGGG